MAEEDYQEIVGQKSWGKVLIGLLLLAVAFGLGNWNEESQVNRENIYRDGPGSAVVLGAPQSLPENEGKLVYFTGTVTTDSFLRDRQLGVYANALKLKRNVQIYQWLEEQVVEDVTTAEGTQKKEDYQYKKGWDTTLHDTLSFRKPIDPVSNVYRANPQKMLFTSAEISATDVKVGDFIVADLVAGALNTYEKLPVPNEILEKFPEEWSGRVYVVEGEYYIGRGSPENPVIGDYKVSYEIVKPGDMLSIVGKQVGNSVQDYPSKHSGNIKNVKIGSFGLEAMFDNLPKEEPVITWSLRAIAALLVLFGMKFLFVGLGNFSSTILYSLVYMPLIFAFAWQENTDVFYKLVGISVVAAALLAFKHLKGLKAKLSGLKMPERKKPAMSESILKEEPAPQDTIPQEQYVYTSVATVPQEEATAPVQQMAQEYTPPEEQNYAAQNLEQETGDDNQGQQGDVQRYEPVAAAPQTNPADYVPQESNYQPQAAETQDEPVSFRSVPVVDPVADTSASSEDFTPAVAEPQETPAAPEEWQEYSEDEAVEQTQDPAAVPEPESQPTQEGAGDEYEDIAEKIRKKMSENSTIEFAESIDQEDNKG